MSVAQLDEWPQPFHQLAEIGSRFGDQVVADVAEVVEVHAGQAGERRGGLGEADQLNSRPDEDEHDDADEAVLRWVGQP